jgi:hypothetical protein
MNQNIFCSKCHRIPSQCCCSSAKELEKGGGWLEETDEQVIANAEKRFPFLKKASEK